MTKTAAAAAAGTPTLTTMVPSPLGPLTLASVAGKLTGLYLDGQRHRPPRTSSWVVDDGAFAEVARQLDAYFAGELTELDVPLDLSGTAFQRQVWSALRAIPYGQTRSYAELAEAAGNRRAWRAAGLANGRNPVAIIVPCHRVVGADGTLTGYGGGLERKQWLLEHERRHTGLVGLAGLARHAGLAGRSR